MGYDIADVFVRGVWWLILTAVVFIVSLLIGRSDKNTNSGRFYFPMIIAASFPVWLLYINIIDSRNTHKAITEMKTSQENADSKFKSICEELKERNNDRVLKKISIDETVSVLFTPSTTILRHINGDGSDRLYTERGSNVFDYRFFGTYPKKSHCFFQTTDYSCNNIFDRIQYIKPSKGWESCSRTERENNEKKCYVFLELELSSGLEKEVEELDAQYVVSERRQPLEKIGAIDEFTLTVSDRHTEQILGETKYFRENNVDETACPKRRSDALAGLFNSIFQRTGRDQKLETQSIKNN